MTLIKLLASGSRKQTKMGKLATPDWVLEGYKSKEEHNKKMGKKTTAKKSGKTYKVKKCPKCGSRNVSVIIGSEEGKGVKGWECKRCKWTGKEPADEEVDEDAFLKIMEEK